MKRKYLLIAIIIFVLLAGIVTTFFLLSKSDKPLNQADTHTTETVEEYNDIAWINESLAQVILNDKITKITQGGTYNIHGNGSSGIYIDTDDKIKLILNDANIINKNGSAIFIENADGVEIELADNSINHLEDSPKREDDENGEGTLFSNASLSLSGNGYLSVKSNYSDAISTKKNLDILSGNYAIISENDGLKGKDSVQIHNGVINIVSKGDGIKTKNEDDVNKGYIKIIDGNINIMSNDDGMDAIRQVVIDGGIIKIYPCLEGIEGQSVVINGGDISITAIDDGINASSKLPEVKMFIEINGGTLNVTIKRGDTDAIDSNGDIYVNGGIVNITTSNSSFDYEDIAEYNGGTIYINGIVTNEIPKYDLRDNPVNQKIEIKKNN